MKELDNNRIEELLPRYCEGRLSEEERLEVEAWIDESEENKRVATQTFALYLAVDTVQVMKKVDTEKALLKVKGKMSDREVEGQCGGSGHNVLLQFCLFRFLPYLYGRTGKGIPVR